MKKIVLTAACLALIAVQPVCAAPNLQITEIWAGGLAGAEATSDWFELTNFGDMAATGLDGNLYYDDDSADPTKDDALVGIDTIAPGESVIYVVSWEDDWATSTDAIDDFIAMWGNVAQVGYVDGGSGLGDGGDAAWVFDGNTNAANLIDWEAYSVTTQEESFVSSPDGTWVENTFAQDGVWGAYQGNSNATDDIGSTPPIGSPGQVPEPTGLALAVIGAALFAARRR